MLICDSVFSWYFRRNRNLQLVFEQRKARVADSLSTLSDRIRAWKSCRNLISYNEASKLITELNFPRNITFLRSTLRFPSSYFTRKKSWTLHGLINLEADSFHVSRITEHLINTTPVLCHFRYLSTFKNVKIGRLLFLSILKAQLVFDRGLVWESID